ncbi:alpha/beta fold hydrolase [Chloroflexota bacterium]
MPYANNGEINIYYEVEGQGPPLVMGHGGAYTLDMWRDWGYAEKLRDEFTLVLLDFRGHGRSDNAPDFTERRTDMADDVIAVLDSLDIAKAHYFGYSMGATVGFRLATSRFATRFTSFILGGMTPYEWPEEMIKAINMSIEGYELRRTDPKAYIQWMEDLLSRRLSDEEKDELLSRDGDAESSVTRQSGLLDTPPLSNEDLAQVRVPSLIYCGDQDPFHAGAMESVNHMPKAAFASLEGLNHITAIVQSDLIVPYIKAFTSVVEQL